MTTETEGGADALAEDTTAAPVAEVTPEAPAEGDQDETGEDTTAAADEGQPKPKKSAKERIDELTAARREAERDAEYWRSKALQQPQQQQAPAPQAAPEEDKEPDPADYEHGDLDARFIRDHATFAANKAFEARMAKMEQERTAREAQTAWQAKEAAAVTKYPDYREKVNVGAERGEWVCTPLMADAIRTSEAGPDVAYHLATNPGEARRIASLDQISQVRELGKLEAKLSAPPAPQAKLKTDAPDPPNVVRGNGGRFEAAPDTGDFTAFQRMAEKITSA
jgi:hypothetical protein